MGYTLNMCLASDEYTFTITDAYGDGTEVVNGGDFGDSKTETFTVNGPAPTNPSPTTAPVTNPTAPPTTVPVTNPTAPPTTAPVTNPTAPPTTAPVTPPTTSPVSSPDFCETLLISLTTDELGSETSFELVDDMSGKVRFAGGVYPSSVTLEESTCLTNGVYIFTISDSYGDGTCCDHGNGSYKLTLEADTLQEGGDFGESESVI